jgi:hypothetical protein
MPFYLGEIDPVVLTHQRKNKIKRTYGWDCLYCDYTSNRHYNTQRHIYLKHGIASGEPVDHMTGETREEKRGATNESLNQSMDLSPYPRIYPLASPVKNREYYLDTTSPTTNPIRLPYLEAQARRLKELGYGVPAQPPHNYGPHVSGPPSWTNAPRYRKNLPALSQYSSNNSQLYYPLYSTYPTIPPAIGPFDASINSLLYNKSLLRCFRQI